MIEGDLADRVLLALRERADDADRPEGSLRTIGEAVGLEDTLEAWLRLAATLSELEVDGLVRTVEGDGAGTASDGADNGGRDGNRDGDEPGPTDPTYRLTPAGRERAVDRYEALATEHVVAVTEDERRELPLRSLPDVYDVSLPRALGALASDGSVYLGDELEPTFVGREAERERLRELLERAREGRPATALVVGEPGIGKTALVEGLCADASERGWETAVGRCRRDGGGPYHPFRDAFDGDGAAAGSEDDAEIEGEGTEAEDGDGDGIEPPFPGVDVTPPFAHDEATYETQLEAFYERVVTWFEARATDRPLLLVLEDLHWADAATIGLLEHLVDALADAPVLVCCTARPTGAAGDDRTDLEPVADAVAAAGLGLRLALSPLDRSGVRALVEGHVGRRGLPSSFVDAIVEETGGNPLFVVETVENMLEDGAIDPIHDRYPDDPDAVAVADVVETTIGDRIDRLDADARAVLEAGAIVGEVVAIDRLEAATDCAASTLGTHVDRLVDAGLWERVDGDRLRFRSDVARSVVTDGIDDDRARRLHRRIADAVAEGDATDAHATVAAHYERGDRPDRALEHWIAAADSARALYAHEDAVAWYERALRIARERDREAAVLEILESLGDVHYTRGEYERADKQFRYVRERTDDPERIRRTYRYQARVRFERGEYEATEQYAAAGLEVDDDAVTREVCWLRDYAAGSHMKRGDLERAIEGFSTQRELAARIDDDLLLGRAYQNLGTCRSNRGEIERGLELLERGSSLLEAAGDDRELARCLNDLAVGYHRDNQFDRAAETFRRARTLAQTTGSLRVAALALSNLGVIAIWQTRWDDARSTLEEAGELATRLDGAELRGFVLGKRAAIERETGDLEAATRDLERALEILRGVESRYHCAQFAVDLGRVRLLCGDFDRAEAELDRAIELATERGYPKWIARGRLYRGCLRRERDTPAAALDELRAALEVATADCDDGVVASVRTELAATLSRAGKHERALAQSSRALDAVPDGYRLLEFHARIVHAGALGRAGDREAARTRLTTLLEETVEASTVARLRCLLQLGALEQETESTRAGRDRLVAGRELATEVGATLYADRFDRRLAERGSSSGDGSDRSSGGSGQRDGNAGTAER